MTGITVPPEPVALPPVPAAPPEAGDTTPDAPPLAAIAEPPAPPPAVMEAAPPAPPDPPVADGCASLRNADGVEFPQATAVIAKRHETKPKCICEVLGDRASMPA